MADQNIGTGHQEVKGDFAADSEFLQGLSERELCELVLIPLLQAMGFTDIRYLHGRDELGKDIVFQYHSPLEGTRHYCAVVKMNRLSGSVTSSQSIGSLYFQIRQAMKTPFRDPFDGKELHITKVFVFTPHDISQACIRSISGEMGDTPQDSINFVDGPKLISMLNEYAPGLFRTMPAPDSRYLYLICQRFLGTKTLSLLGGEQTLRLDQVYTGGDVVPTNAEDARLLNFANPIPDSATQSLPDVMEHHTRLVVIADVGSGKTTLLQRLVLAIGGAVADPLPVRLRMCMPIFMPMSSLPPSAFASYESLVNAIDEHVEHEVGREYLRRHPAMSLLLLLDGFDEINLHGLRDMDYTTVAKYLTNLSQRYTAGVVVTSRPSRVPQLGSSFRYFRLCPFTDTQIREFITKWFPDSEARREEVARKILDTPDLGAFCRTPLMLTIYVILARRFGTSELPTTRSAVYDRILDLLLGKWDTIRGVVNQFSVELKTHVLEVLAYDNMVKNRRWFHLSDFSASVEKVLERRRDQKHYSFGGSETIREILDEVYFRSSLLRQPEKDVFEFVHHSFQEFFAAKRLVRLGGMFTHVIFLDDWWRNSLRFYFGLIGTMDGFSWPSRMTRKTRIGLTLLEYLAEAEYTLRDTRQAIYKVFCHDILYGKDVTEAELAVCMRVGDEIIDSLYNVVSSKGFHGNLMNFFRVLLTLNSDRSQSILFSSGALLSNFEPIPLLNALEKLASFAHEYEGSKLLAAGVKALATKEDTIKRSFATVNSELTMVYLANRLSNLQKLVHENLRAHHTGILPQVEQLIGLMEKLRKRLGLGQHE
ncbi:NACHT domain-containing protein [bacterium]|nr:NACHT domain-containing protein [bacterium]